MKNHIAIILSGVDDAVIDLLETKDNRPDGMRRVEFIIGSCRIIAYKVGKTEGKDGGIKIEVTDI